MLREEKNYDFRKRMRKLHDKDIRDPFAVASAEETVFEDGLVISVPEGSGKVVINGARHFIDFLFISLGVSAALTEKAVAGANTVRVIIDESYGTYKAFKLEVSADGTRIVAHDERGAMQAFFLMEEEMKLRRAPFLPEKTFERAPKFYPRMTHSGYCLDVFPEEHLAQIAYAGMDALLVLVFDKDRSMFGKADFGDLIDRASDWGLDVYAYSFIGGAYHPDHPDAEAYYESTYGSLFKDFGFKGVVLVGESIGFPSKDERASNVGVVDYVPVQKPLTSFFPCRDYAEYVGLINKVVSRNRPGAEVVFWTYNWGPAKVEDRLELIRRLPKDITLLVTFETMHRYPLPGGSLTQFTTDYTISFIGPSFPFESEAEEAHKRGIKLYSMTNTAGATWDMGGIPYVPAPDRWMARFNAVCEAKDKWGLCGLMECHEYGFWPSFISELAKYVYETDGDPEQRLLQLLSYRYGKDSLPTVRKALSYWSDAFGHITPCAEDQYSAFRVGPSYPFNFTEEFRYPDEYFAQGNFSFDYYPTQNEGWHSVSSERIPYEIAELEKTEELLKKGLELLNSVENANEELEYLRNMGELMVCYVRTGINNKHWHVLRHTLLACADHERIRSLTDEAEELLLNEKENSLRAIPLVKRDSRLGWDPRMFYRTDAKRIEWKIRYIDFVINVKLGKIREGLELNS